PCFNSTPMDTKLLAIDAVWKFNDSGTDLGTAWRDPAYNDTAWAARANFTNRAVPGLFNTGVDASGVVQPQATLDLHYILTVAAQGAVPTNALVILNHPSWLANDTVSSWIGVVNPGSANVAFGDYNYQTTFSLAGFLLSTVQ